MNKPVILLAAAAFFFAGCDKFTDPAAKAKKMAEAQESASAAEAKVAAKLAAVAAGGSTPVKARQGGEALVGILCAYPRLVDEVEGDMDLIEAISGAGGDRSEVRRQFMEFQARYRPMMEKALPSRGSSYAEFANFSKSFLPGMTSAAQKKKFLALIKEKCPRGNAARIEKTAGGLMHYCEGAPPR